MSKQNLSSEILKYIGGIENVETVMNCQTRLRLKLIDTTKADEEKIKNLDGVFGLVVNGNSFQVVVGPGKSSKLGEEVSKILNEYKQDSAKSGNKSFSKSDTENSAVDINSSIEKNKKKYKKTSPVSIFLKHIGNIFVPIIPAFIGCGLLLAISEMCAVFIPEFSEST